MDSGALARILVAGDDEELVRGISICLRAAGYDCVTAPGREEGFSRFQKGDTDLVITDVVMPDSDGFSMREWIRQLSHVPIIVLTGYEQCREPFLQDFPDIKCLLEPYNSEELVRLVKAKLSGRDEPAVR